MRTINFPEAQQVLGRPNGMLDTECSPAPVARGIYAEQYPAVITCWEPTPEERQAIASGANIYLHVVGHTMQPAILATEITMPLVQGGGSGRASSVPPGPPNPPRPPNHRPVG